MSRPGPAPTPPPTAAPDAPQGWWRSAPGAEVVAAGQLLVVLAVRMALPDMEDDYGRIAWGQFAIVGLFLAVLFTPVLVAFTAFLHALTVTRPALALARRTGRGWAAPAWLAAGSAVLALYPWSLGASYAVSWACVAGFGVLPLRVALRAARLGREPGAIVRATARNTVLLALATLVGGAVLGWMVQYRPPQLTQAAYVGEWRGADGGAIRLQGNGVATVEGIPRDHGGGVVTRCTATGTWAPARAEQGRRGGVMLEVTGCAGWEERWQVSGTAAHPELFQLTGDPDSPELRIVRRVAPAGGTPPTG
ncbi:hypothetical protein [Streptomyces sp. NPDC048340]|uniref:hypothetical protein n=1 Tax=Streptomyces sp. NPDC048340 TaxID=3365537 RepID=UPI00371EE85C